MKKILLALCLIAVCPAFGANNLRELCTTYNRLNTLIRDGKTGKKEALTQMQALIPQIKQAWSDAGGENYPDDRWIFPVEKYTGKAIGGKNGSGYQSAGYDFFAGNRHKGHPAHDIFIRDLNQDGKDDKTNRFVNVLSLSGGVVVACEPFWEVGSLLRGGKYIWIYEPFSNSLFYYAHNEAVFVKTGDMVKPGDRIATVGRTGLNANKKRSPTHLHFMQLRFDTNFYPRPVNCYGLLCKTRH